MLACALHRSGPGAVPVLRLDDPDNGGSRRRSHRCTKGMQRLLTASCVSCTVYEVARTALFQYTQPCLTESGHVLAARA